MPFDLYVTGINGDTNKSIRSPYTSRRDTGRTVRIVIANGDESPDEMYGFAGTVIAAPLGETVTHTVTGFAFRTEETTT